MQQLHSQNHHWKTKVLQDSQGTQPADPPATKTTFPNFLLKSFSSQETSIQLNQMLAEIGTCM